MITTHAADNIGKPDNAYALVAFLSESTEQQLSLLLTELSSELGENIWVMPTHALHITLCEIIQPKVYLEDKQILFEKHSEDYERITAEILVKYGPIKISFDTIQASSQAIIVRGKDDGSFEKIRKELVDKLPLPRETKMPPDIIHSSVARFLKEIPLSKVEKVTKQHSIQISEEVTEFRLINNLLPPLLKYKTIRTYPLFRK